MKFFCEKFHPLPVGAHIVRPSLTKRFQMTYVGGDAYIAPFGFYNTDGLM